MGGDHVPPPGFFDVAFQLDTQRSIIPETVQSPVDFAGLEKIPAPFTKGDELVHFHGKSGFVMVDELDAEAPV
jgi:hypothetical protein